jgi:hypothetical protein
VGGGGGACSHAVGGGGGACSLMNARIKVLLTSSLCACENELSHQSGVQAENE